MSMLYGGFRIFDEVEWNFGWGLKVPIGLEVLWRC